MEIDDALNRRGGIASRADLVAACGRAAVDRALASGGLVPVARGRYAGGHVDEDVVRAHALTGHLSHESAALRQGWEVLHVPDLPHVTVPAKRRVTARARDQAAIHFADLHVDEVTGSWTNRERTMSDCLRSLPFPSALAVADSALRNGCGGAWLERVASDVTGPGAKQARRVGSLATPLAANPFESALRAICLGVPGLNVRPQVPIYAGTEFLGRPDLVDTDLEIVAEADSFAWHGTRQGLVRDARRYNSLAVAGWMVLRFTWEDVLLEPVRVGGTLREAVRRQEERGRTGRRRPDGLTSPVRLRATGW
ncbi:MAG: hypothetical protein ACI379_05440 [Nocardioides sp.]|uniref:hypothetical protein n=1 Tax=Nocardioides sp. TaxID=35761 RepID=UPI003F0B7F62